MWIPYRIRGEDSGIDTQEKVALNLSPVDLAKIDYLVDHGFYSNRSDFMRTAIRSQLRTHDAVVSDDALSSPATGSHGIGPFLGGVGVLKLGKRQFQDHLASAKGQVRLFVVGALFLDADVSLDLVKRAIGEARIYGTIHGPSDVVEYIRSLAQPESADRRRASRR